MTSQTVQNTYSQILMIQIITDNVGNKLTTCLGVYGLSANQLLIPILFVVYYLIIKVIHIFTNKL